MASTRRTALIGTVAAAALLATASPSLAQDRSYILTTATTGGTYYPVGVAIATLVKVRLMDAEGIDMSAISSAGSGENIGLMRDGQAQFGILQGLFGRYAAQGSGPLEGEGPQAWLRSVANIWPNVEHFVIADDFVETGTIDDLSNLAGRPFSIGARNSGTEGSGREILGGLGIDPEIFDIVFQGYNPSAEGLQNATIDGVNMPGGVPVSAVTQAFAARSDITLLAFDDDQIAAPTAKGRRSGPPTRSRPVPIPISTRTWSPSPSPTSWRCTRMSTRRPSISSPRRCSRTWSSCATSTRRPTS